MQTSIRTVSEETAYQNQQTAIARKASARAAKEAQRIADQKRADEARARKLAESKLAPTQPAEASTVWKQGNLALAPLSPEEKSRLETRAKQEKAEYARREALTTRSRLVYWMTNDQPSLEVIHREFVAAGFLPTEEKGEFSCEGILIKDNEGDLVAKIKVLSELKGTNVTDKLSALRRYGFTQVGNDDHGNHIYRRGEVEITLFLRSEVDKRARVTTGPTTDLKKLAANRRLNQANHRPSTEVAKPKGSAGMTKEEMEKRRVANEEANRKAKAERALKALQKKEPKVKPPKADGDKKGKKNQKKK